METHRTEATVGEHGRLTLENLPFEEGQPVEVLILAKSVTQADPEALRGSVLEYHHPFEPVAAEDWEALR